MRLVCFHPGKCVEINRALGQRPADRFDGRDLRPGKSCPRQPFSTRPSQRLVVKRIERRCEAPPDRRRACG